MRPSDESSDIETIEVHAPYSLILIDGSPAAAVPRVLDGIVGATGSCVAVGTLSEQDGPTTVRLMHGDTVVGGRTNLEVFDGVIDAPSGNVFVRSAEDDVYLSRAVQTPTVRLVITADALREPSAIDIRVFEVPVVA